MHQIVTWIAWAASIMLNTWNPGLKSGRLAGAGIQTHDLQAMFDIWTFLNCIFWPHKSSQSQTDLSDPLHLSVRSVQTTRCADWVQELIQASTDSPILNYQSDISIKINKYVLLYVTSITCNHSLSCIYVLSTSRNHFIFTSLYSKCNETDALRLGFLLCCVNE